MDKSWIQTLIPLAVLAVVFALRFRGLKKARAMRPGRMWIAPAIVTAMIALALVAMPPPPLGWAAFVGGLLLGAVVGWQRARMLHLERDPATGKVLVRQTPAGLIFLIVIFAARRLIAPTGSRTGAALTGTALIVTDGFMGFALGMVLANRFELWRRAKTAPVQTTAFD